MKIHRMNLLGLVVLILQELPRFGHGAETLASEALQALGQALPCHVAQVQIAQAQGFLDMEIGNDPRNDLRKDLRNDLRMDQESCCW